MPAEGGKPRELLELKGNENIPGLRGLAWVPDSRTILFVKLIKAGGQEPPNRGRNELWLLATETGEQRKLGDLLKGRGIEISLHPNGRNMVFSTGVYKSEIWVMENYLPTERESKKGRE
jgi:Tol biopolymer transport system component